METFIFLYNEKRGFVVVVVVVVKYDLFLIEWRLNSYLPSGVSEVSDMELQTSLDAV